MEYTPAISQLAALLADPGRALMLWSLMDGSARPAGELALLAGLSASAASAHLARLTDGGVLSVEARGRARYYRLASIEVASALEALASAAQLSREQRPRPLPASHGTPLPLRQARTCYDHLAGQLAVGMFERMATAGWLVQHGRQLELTDAGAAGLAELGLELAGLRRMRRQFACACPDWSERKPHLGGALGAALLAHCLEARWLRRLPQSRALHVSPAGARAIQRIAAPAG